MHIQPSYDVEHLHSILWCITKYVDTIKRHYIIESSQYHVYVLPGYDYAIQNKQFWSLTYLNRMSFWIQVLLHSILHCVAKYVDTSQSHYIIVQFEKLKTNNFDHWHILALVILDPCSVLFISKFPRQIKNVNGKESMIK